MNIPHAFEQYWRSKTSRTGLHQAEQREAFEAGVNSALSHREEAQPITRSDRKKEIQKPRQVEDPSIKPDGDKEAQDSAV